MTPKLKIAEWHILAYPGPKKRRMSKTKIIVFLDMRGLIQTMSLYHTVLPKTPNSMCKCSRDSNEGFIVFRLTSGPLETLS